MPTVSDATSSSSSSPNVCTTSCNMPLRKCSDCSFVSHLCGVLSSTAVCTMPYPPPLPHVRRPSATQTAVHQLIPYDVTRCHLEAVRRSSGTRLTHHLTLHSLSNVRCNIIPYEMNDGHIIIPDYIYDTTSSSPRNERCRSIPTK